MVGQFYNDGTPGTGVAGNIFARIEVRADSVAPPGSLRVLMGVFRCGDPDCLSGTELLFDPTTFGPVAVGSTHTVGLAWDGAQTFTFTLDGVPFAFNTGIPVAGPAKSPSKAVQTFAGPVPNAAGEGGSIRATFDNVVRNGALYDDFSAPRLDPAKWQNPQELIKRIKVSFEDVSASHFAWLWIESLVAAGVTAGCGIDPPLYCPESSVTREQMAVFLLKAKEGSGFTPGACTTAPFADVPCTSPFARWIQELVNRGVTAGCGGGNYCPTAPVTREQMAVFLLKTLEGSGFMPPACASPSFGDVPCSSPFAIWVEELVRRGITAGCAVGLYCPINPVTRAQMAVFLVRTFALPFTGGVLESAIARFGSNGSNNLSLLNANSITSMAADVTVLEVFNAGAEPLAGLRGTFYNDGSGGPGNIGDVLAGVEILDAENGSGLKGGFFVVRCTSEDCASFDQLVADETTFGSVALGATHRLSLAWDGVAFTFGFDGATASFTPVGVPAAGLPSGPFKALVTRVRDIGSANEGGFIRATFDNFEGL